MKKTFLDKFWFRLVLVLITAFFITEIGSTDSLFSRIIDFLKEYLATTIISLAVVELVYFINARLDRRNPWGVAPTWLRVLLQVLLAWLLPVICALGLASFYFWVYGVDIRRTDYMYFALPIVMILLLLLNILFIMAPAFLLLFQSNPVEEMHQQEKIGKPLKRIFVPNGISGMILEPGNIKAAYIINKKVVIRNKRDMELITPLTLDELENDYLPAEDFFRVNRQLIIHRRTCIGFEPLEYNKMKVELSIQSPVEPIVSQLRSKNFREWITAEE